LLLASVFAAGAASAQFFPLQLPREDFIWTWGRRIPELENRRFPDLDIQGTEGGFRCELTAKLSPGNSMTQPEIRQLETDLRTNLYFVQAVANTMYYLDQGFDLEWGVLDCDKYEEETDEATRQEREDKARERAERARERRRERQQQD
jgi:hypothetical protein